MMKKISPLKTSAMLLLTGAALLGCNATQPTQPSSNAILPLTEAAFQKSLQTRKGQKVETVSAEWGAPLYVKPDAKTGDQYYRYQINPKTLHFDDEDITIWCEVDFTVDKSGTIKKTGYFGNTCKAPDSTPGAYGGGLAGIRSKGELEGPKQMIWFSLVEIYDAPKPPDQCQGEVFSRGSAVPARCLGDQIPAQALRAKIRAYREDTSSGGKKITTLAEGIVGFTPKADTYYEVTGKTEGHQTKLWIEDTSTHQAVTQVIESR